MKMLLVCPHFRNIEYGVAVSFKRLGVDVYPIFFNMGMDKKHIYQRVKNKLGMSIEKFLLNEKRKFNEQLLEKYQLVQPDCVYIIQGRWVSAESIKQMKKKSFIALYLWDMVNLFPEMYDTFHQYNIIYSFDKHDCELLNKKGYNAKFKPSGYDDSVYFPVQQEKEYDVSFVGAMYPERVALLKELIKKLPGIRWGIFGEYAPMRNPVKWLKWRFSSDYSYFRNKNISKAEANLVYNKSKIILSIVRANQIDGWSARLPEILGAKAFQITNYYSSVEKEFQGCLCLYKNNTELVTLIQYYLQNEPVREAIAEQGYQKVKRFYSDDLLNKIIIDDYFDWQANHR